MTEEYHTQNHYPPPDRPERGGVSRKRVIEAAKEAVPVIDLANLLCGPCGLRKVGNRWVGQCPLPDHEDRSPSFTVYPETNSWFCFGCLRGGDVIELARFAWGYEKHEAPMAAAYVLRTFGHSIPERPPSWHQKRERQRPIRGAIYEAKVYAVRRRLYRWFFEPMILAIEDEQDRAHDAQLFWEITDRLARYLIDNMMAGNSGQ